MTLMTEGVYMLDLKSNKKGPSTKVNTNCDEVTAQTRS